MIDGGTFVIMTTTIAKENRRRLRTSYFSAVLSISLVLFMVGLLGILVMDARKLSDYVKEHVQLSVYLNDAATPPEIVAFRQLISESDFARETFYISKEAALDSLKKELGEDAVGMLESNPLPASIDVRVKADYASVDSLEKIKASLSSNGNLVDEVSYQRTQVDKISRNFRSVAWALLAFSALLLLIAIALINNTIKLSLYSSRFVIKSMQLVGATQGFIRRPFIVRSVKHGLFAGMIACVLLAIILYLLTDRFPDLGQLTDISSIGMLFSAIIVLGILISGISTYLAVNKHLKVRVEDLY